MAGRRGCRWVHGLGLAWVLLSPVLLRAAAPPSAANLPGDDKPLWNIAWLTDTQCYANGRGEVLPLLLERVRANRPRMVIHTGDTTFEWVNRGSWPDVLGVLRIEDPPIEFHLSPGNHDDEPTLKLKSWLLRAASRGIYPIDTGEVVPDAGYHKDRKTEDVSGPGWPIWNPEVAAHPNWQPDGGKPYYYVFKRGGIRFIVLDAYWREEHEAWLRRTLLEPDDSSVSIVLEHKSRGEFDYDALVGRHNVRLVLSGHIPAFKKWGGEVTFVRAAGLNGHDDEENDAFTLWVYKDRLRLDRYVLPPGLPRKPVEGPTAIWTCTGKFTDYRRPETVGQHPRTLTLPDDRKLQYQLYLPATYNDDDRRWPTILFLHGAGERGDDVERVKIHGPASIVERKQDFPFVVVSPLCPQGQWWSVEDLTVLLDDLAKHHRIDEDRVYVTGLSMGGFGTWNLATAYPDRFAAIAPICGGGDPTTASRIARLPIWVFHGAKDNVVSLGRSQEMVDALKASGGEPKFTIYPDAGHNSWTATYDNPELYEWFLRHRRRPREQ